MVIHAGGAAVFQKLSHAYKRAIIHAVVVEAAPYLVERAKPVEQLEVLHLC